MVTNITTSINKGISIITNPSVSVSASNDTSLSSDMFTRTSNIPTLGLALLLVDHGPDLAADLTRDLDSTLAIKLALALAVFS